MRLSDFKVLSFDCYGTLIDWESGIWTALRSLAAKAGGKAREAALILFGHHESAQEKETPSLKYSELLARVHARLAAEWGVAADAGADQVFGASLGDWPAFSDSAEALAYLKPHFKLVILSNVDRGSFAGSNRRLGVTFDAICTAEDIGSYKPDPANFRYLLARLGELGHTPSELLHVSPKPLPRSRPRQRCRPQIRLDRPPCRRARLGRYPQSRRPLRFPLHEPRRTRGST